MDTMSSKFYNGTMDADGSVTDLSSDDESESQLFTDFASDYTLKSHKTVWTSYSGSAEKSWRH